MSYHRKPPAGPPPADSRVYRARRVLFGGIPSPPAVTPEAGVSTIAPSPNVVTPPPATTAAQDFAREKGLDLRELAGYQDSLGRALTLADVRTYLKTRKH